MSSGRFWIGGREAWICISIALYKKQYLMKARSKQLPRFPSVGLQIYLTTRGMSDTHVNTIFG